MGVKVWYLFQMRYRLTSAGGGLAGDTAALAQAQNLQNGSNTGSATGDDSPILPLVLALGGSALAIALIVIFLVKRRRKQ